MPGFFDEYVDAGGGSFISSDEKAQMIEAGVAFVIKSIRFNSEGRFGAEYKVDVELSDAAKDLLDREEADATISFPSGSVESRDRMLDSMNGWLEQGGDPILARLDKVGRSVLIAAVEEGAAATSG